MIDYWKERKRLLEECADLNKKIKDRKDELIKKDVLGKHLLYMLDCRFKEYLELEKQKLEQDKLKYDDNRVYTNNERQLDTRIDGRTVQGEALLLK